MFVLPKTGTFNFSTTGNLANGLNKTSTNELGLYTNNTDRLHITNIGRVGIGTTTPDSQLHIIGDLHVSTTSQFDGNVTMNGTLTLGGATTMEDLTLNNDLLVRGDLTVQGTTTTIDSTTLTVDDSMIRLADNNGDDIIDIGFYGMYVDTGVTKYRGIIHDASVDQWTLFTDETNEPLSSLSLSSNPIISGNNNGVAIGITAQLANDTGAIRLHIHKNANSGCNLQFTNEQTGIESERGFRMGLTSLEEGQIWLYENKSMKFGTNNTESMRITEDGSLNVLSNTFRVDSGGNVGIGTDTPGSKLDVQGGDVTLGVTMFHTNFSTGLVGIGTVTSLISPLTVYGDLHLRETTTQGNWNITPEDATNIKITKVGTGNAEFHLTTGTGGTGYLDTNLNLGAGQINLDCNGNSWFNGGNVGIGTATPGELLHLYSNTNCGLQLDCDADNNGTNIAFIDFYGGGTLQGNIAMNESNSNNLQFNAATSNNIEMVTGGGNVGIGVTNPSEQLEVGGIMRIREVNTTTEGGELQFQMSDGVNLWNIDTQGSSISQQRLRFFNSYLTGGIVLTTTGQLSLAQGGLFEPTIDFALGDADTGLHHPVDNTLTMYTGGSEQMRIESNGDVGIGTDNPGTKLHIYDGSAAVDLTLESNFGGATFYIDRAASTNEGTIQFHTAGVLNWIMGMDNSPTGSQSDFIIKQQNNGTGTDGLIIKTSGNVGIGSTLPGNQLVISADGGGSTPQLLVEPVSTTSQDSSIEIRGARSASVINDHASLFFTNYDDNLSATNKLGKITGLVTNDTTNIGDLAFYNFSDGSTSSETMRLTSGGNVGIGTNNPASKLHVEGNESTGDGTDAAIQITNIGTNGDTWYLRVGANGTNTPAGGFSIGDTSAYRLSIDGSGNVGIGSTVPRSTLDLSNDGSILLVGDQTHSAQITESSYQSTHTVAAIAGGGFIQAPWIRCAGIENSGELGAAGTAIIFGDAVPTAANNEPDHITFAVNAATKMTIDSTNVGIGTTTPGTPLHIYSSSISGLLIERSTTTASSLVQFKNATSTNGSRIGINANNEILIEERDGNNITIHTNDVEKMVIQSDGRTRFYSTLTGTTDEMMQIRKAATSTTNNEYISFFRGATGTSNGTEDGYIATNGSSVLSLVDVSDVRLKENIIEYVEGYNIIKNLRSVEFDWKDNDKPNDCIGFIAQEVKEYLPRSVHIFGDENEEDPILGLSNVEMIPVLWSALKKTIEDKETLELEVETLKTELELIKSHLGL